MRTDSEAAGSHPLDNTAGKGDADPEDCADVDNEDCKTGHGDNDLDPFDAEDDLEDSDNDPNDSDPGDIDLDSGDTGLDPGDSDLDLSDSEDDPVDKEDESDGDSSSSDRDGDKGEGGLCIFITGSSGCDICDTDVVTGSCEDCIVDTDVDIDESKLDSAYPCVVICKSK